MRKIIAIMLNTFRESVRSKVLYSFFFFAILMVLASSVFSATTVGDQMMLLKDFGLAILSLAGVTFVVVSGSSMLAKELQRRTIFNILAKPVYRSEFILGKFLGLLITALCLIALMGAGLSTLLWCFEGAFDSSLLIAYFGIALELVIVCACVLFFSSVVVTPMLNGLFTFGAFLAGRSVPYLLHFTLDQEIPTALRSIARVLYWVLPHLDQLYFANAIVYKTTISGGYLLWATTYTVAYAIALLAVSSMLFSRRDFQ